jgi:hypothetical protein
MTNLNNELFEDTYMDYADETMKAADLLALPEEPFTAEELVVSPEFLARCCAVAAQAPALRQMQAAIHTDVFQPISPQALLEQLAARAQIALQSLLDWWELDLTFRKPSSLVAWAEFGKALSMASYKAELCGRIGLAQRVSPAGWNMAAAHCRGALDERALLHACDLALQELEQSYPDDETRTLRQLKAAISRVYGEIAGLTS